jgi:hypothetical protein
LGSKVGRLARASSSPVLGSRTTTLAPTGFQRSTIALSSSSTSAWIAESRVRVRSSPRATPGSRPPSRRSFLPSAKVAGLWASRPAQALVEAELDAEGAFALVVDAADDVGGEQAARVDALGGRLEGDAGELPALDDRGLLVVEDHL